MQVCHISTWSADEVASNVHVTSHRNPELRAVSCALPAGCLDVKAFRTNLIIMVLACS